MNNKFKISSRMVIFIIITISVFIIGGVVYATTYHSIKEIPSSINIVSNNPSVEIYSDSSCKNVLTNLNFGTITKLENNIVQASKTIYIKNIGNVPVSNIWVELHGWLWSYSVTTNQSYGKLSLNCGDIGSCTLKLNIDNSISIGTINFILAVCQNDL